MPNEMAPESERCVPSVTGLSLASGAALERVNSTIVRPLVSVVIPTRNRPHLLLRALRSVLNQGLTEIEVVVVIDGPDPATEEVLLQIEDDRLHVLPLKENVGGSEARNIGVRCALGKWVALLDDDDEWLPGKLESQWVAGESLDSPFAFVASRFIERTESAERILPRRGPEPGEPFSDYLFVRQGWNSGEGFLQTSTWFVSRELLIRMPFTPGLKRCQDLDWLLHATAFAQTRVAIVPEVLAIFHHEEHGTRVSRTADWSFLYDWARLNRQYFTPRAFSFFIATFCAPSAARQQAGMRTFLHLLRTCAFTGGVSTKCLVLLMVCWWMPEARRRSLRASWSARRGTLANNGSLIVHRPLPGKVG